MSVYLDHNATGPLSEPARAAMLPYLEGRFGNPSSIHAFGQETAAAVDRARRSVKALVGGASGDLVFTGSGTEAVLLGTAGAAGTRAPAHAVFSAVEHTAGMDAARLLETRGWRVTRVPPETSGAVSPERVREAFREDTVLVSLLHANNETGVIQPVKEVSDLCRERGVLFHVDAVQSVGKIPVAAESWADLVSVSAHKMGGPKGVGALWKRPPVPLAPIVPGTQEKGFRGGTLNVPAIVGFGAAAEASAVGMEERARKLETLRDLLENLAADLPGARLTGAEAWRLPNTVHLTFDPGAGPDLVPALDLAGFAVSSGSACTAGSTDPSHVLLAMGVSPERARTAVRVSFGPGNTREDVDRFVAALKGLIGSSARKP